MREVSGVDSRWSKSASLGIAYLDFFLAERDAVHNAHASDFVRLGVSLILCFQNGMVLGTARPGCVRKTRSGI